MTTCFVTDLAPFKGILRWAERCRLCPMVDFGGETRAERGEARREVETLGPHAGGRGTSFRRAAECGPCYLSESLGIYVVC